MASLYRNNLAGQVSDNPLSSGATTINSTAFANLPTVADPDIMWLTLDPDGDDGAPEVVKVTAHTASATSVTVVRAQQGTTARAHNQDTVWKHAVTRTDAEGWLTTVDTANLEDDAVTTAKIDDEAVTTAKLDDGAVTLAKMAVESVDSDQYVDGSIDLAHLAADSVDGSKILDDSIDSQHYVDGSIETAHLADEQVTTAKIADGAVTADKLDTSTWTGVTFQNSWVNAGGNGAVQYRKVADDVQIRGRMTGGSLSAICFTLPTGYRPPTPQQFPCVGPTASAAALQVGTNGECGIFASGNSTVDIQVRFSTTS